MRLLSRTADGELKNIRARSSRQTEPQKRQSPRRFSHYAYLLSTISAQNSCKNMNIADIYILPISYIFKSNFEILLFLYVNYPILINIKTLLNTHLHGQVKSLGMPVFTDVCAGEAPLLFRTHHIDHLTADRACLTGGEVAVVALLEVHAYLVGCLHLESFESLSAFGTCHTFHLYLPFFSRGSVSPRPLCSSGLQ